MNRFNLVVIGALAAASSACGGVAGDSLFGGSGAGGSGGAAATSASSGTTSSGPTSSSSATASSSSTTSSSTTASSSSSTASSSSTTAASSSGSPLPPVNCADSTCPAGDICCFNPTSGNPPDHCGKSGQCGQGFVELTCSGPEGCPGEICCGRGMVVGSGPAQTFQYAGVSCAATCANTSTYVEYTLCSAQDPGVCGAGQQCTQSQVLGSNYYLCE